jgi:uncharacterized protein (DUF1684 family)
MDHHDHDHDHEHAHHDHSYAGQVTAGRQAKDDYFRTAPNSPVRDARATFEGLSYFAIDERYRIVVPGVRPASPDDEPLVLDTSDGRSRTYRRAGFLDFDVDGQPLTLTGFTIAAGDPDSLFVPFADGTSGRESYGSGRYLDLEIEPDGSVVLDFNLAYHPFCAYSSVYSCPLTPPENRLAVPIPAGERLPDTAG